MKPILGPAHSINVRCRQCGAEIGSPCRNGLHRPCPDREFDNVHRMERIKEAWLEMGAGMGIVKPKPRRKARRKGK